MNVKPPPMTPSAMRIEQALRQSAPLTRLRALMADSQARFEAVSTCLPAGLLPHVSPGPIDELGWTLLAANAAVSAKLRQLLPRIDAALEAQGWQSTPVRVKVLHLATKGHFESACKE